MRKIILAAAAVAAVAAPMALTVAPANAAGDRDCGDFASQRAAQIFYLKAGGLG